MSDSPDFITMLKNHLDVIPFAKEKNIIRNLAEMTYGLCKQSNGQEPFNCFDTNEQTIKPAVFSWLREKKTLEDVGLPALFIILCNKMYGGSHHDTILEDVAKITLHQLEHAFSRDKRYYSGIFEDVMKVTRYPSIAFIRANRKAIKKKKSKDDSDSDDDDDDDAATDADTHAAAAAAADNDDDDNDVVAAADDDDDDDYDDRCCCCCC